MESSAAPLATPIYNPDFSNETSTFIASQSFPKRAWHRAAAQWIFINLMNGQTQIRIHNAVEFRGGRGHIAHWLLTN